MKPQKTVRKPMAETVGQLYQAISTLKNDQELENFFQDLCTPAELQAMAERWEVVALLKEDKSYREIYELTGVSVTTVGRVARVLEFGQGGYALALERQNTMKQ